jgi:hypothetical protein
MFSCCCISRDSRTQALTTEPPNVDMSGVAQHVWPVHTELVVSSGSDRLKLTHQRPMVCLVLHKAIKHLRATMLFTNVFPDICVALGLIKDCLLTAANQLRPGSDDVFERLTHDQDYLTKVTPLVRLNVVWHSFH